MNDADDRYAPEHISEYVARLRCVKEMFDDVWHVVSEEQSNETFCGRVKKESAAWLVVVKYERLVPYLVSWRFCVSCGFFLDDKLTQVVRARHAWEEAERVKGDAPVEAEFAEYGERKDAPL
jgi:hypothetical protein